MFAPLGMVEAKNNSSLFTMHNFFCRPLVLLASLLSLSSCSLLGVHDEKWLYSDREEFGTLDTSQAEGRIFDLVSNHSETLSFSLELKSDAFSLLDTAGIIGPVKPDIHYEWQIEFRPHAAKEYSDTMFIHTSDSPVPHIVVLTGTGK